eukprot:2270536-Prymnesium_polylepis.1
MQQFLRGKYDPSLVEPKLFLLKPVCNRRVFAKLLTEVAVRSYWRSGDAVPACLQNLSLTKLADAMLGKRWKAELDFPNQLHLTIACAYNDMNPNTATSPYTDVWYITSVAEPAAS